MVEKASVRDREIAAHRDAGGHVLRHDGADAHPRARPDNKAILYDRGRADVGTITNDGAAKDIDQRADLHPTSDLNVVGNVDKTVGD